MTRDQIAAQVGRALAVFEEREKLDDVMRSANKPDDRNAVMKRIEKNEHEAKAVLTEIGIDTLHVLHRIADALEGKNPNTILPREKL